MRRGWAKKCQRWLIKSPVCDRSSNFYFNPAVEIEECVLALKRRKVALTEIIYHASATRKEPLLIGSDLAAPLRPMGH